MKLIVGEDSVGLELFNTKLNDLFAGELVMNGRAWVYSCKDLSFSLVCIYTFGLVLGVCVGGCMVHMVHMCVYYPGSTIYFV